MVKEGTKSGVVRYVCELCDMAYADKKTALACEEWCRKYKSCNLEIIKKAV